MHEVLRQEKKYLLTLADSHTLCGYLDQVMIADPHNSADGYTVRTLYFDTIDNDDFNDKLNGVELRRKIRLRIYDPAADFAMLELKQKQGPYQRKRSLRLTANEAARMTRGDYSDLLRYSDPFAAEMYGLINRLCYRPKAIVEYRRQAYIARENRTRVTIDRYIRATESSFDLFSPTLNQYPVLDPFNVILEVKYSGFLLSYIKDLVNRVDRSELAASKYCMARRVSLHYNQ